MLLKNKTFWLLISMIVFIFFGVLYSFLEVEWLMYPVFAALAYIVVIGLIMIAYAWIINPLKNLFK